MVSFWTLCGFLAGSLFLTDPLIIVVVLCIGGSPAGGEEKIECINIIKLLTI